MALAETRYSGDGTTTDFTIGFAYRTRSSVKVYLSGTLQTLSTDYTFFDDDTIRMTTAPPDGDSNVVIRRETDFSARPNGSQWEDRSDIAATDHNTEDDVDLYRSQENFDRRGMQKSISTGQWDAEGLRIESGSDPLASDHYVTLGFLQDYISGGRTGVAGIYRTTVNGDGVTRTISLIPSGEGLLSDKDQVVVAYNGKLLDPSQYELSSDKLGVTMDDPIPNGTLVDARVITSSLTTFTDGSIDTSKISLAEDYLLTGDSSDLGSAVARSSLLLSELGAAAANLDIGGNRITQVASPVNVSDAATKGYTDGLHDSLAPFETVGNANVSHNSGGASATYQNTSGKTLMAIFTIVMTDNAGREWQVQYADDTGFSTGLVSITGHKSGSDFKGHGQIVALIPPSKYYRIREIQNGGDWSSKATVTVQTGQTP